MRVASRAVSCTSTAATRSLGALGATLVGAAIGVPALAFMLNPQALMGPALLVAVALFAAGVAVSALARGRASAGVLRPGAPGVIELGDALTMKSDTISRTFTAADVLDGWREEHGAVHQVVAQLVSGETLAVQVDDATTADAVLGALGVAPHQRAVTLRVGSMRSPWERVVAAIFAALGAVAAIPLIFAFVIVLAHVVVGTEDADPYSLFVATLLMSGALGVFLGATRMLGVRTVRIGRDGVSMKLGLSPARFVSFRGMSISQAGRRVSLSSGTTSVRFPTTGVAEAKAIVARVEEGRRAFHERAAQRAELLSRQGRPLDAWRASLADLARAEDYRTGLGPDDLVAIVEDAASFPDERVAAATVLAALPSDDRRSKRVRVAVVATVDPKLRIALERALDGVIDESALAAAEARHGGA